jgi:hypothetical protein
MLDPTEPEAHVLKEVAELASDVAAADDRYRLRHFAESEDLVAGPTWRIERGALGGYLWPGRVCRQRWNSVYPFHRAGLYLNTPFGVVSLLASSNPRVGAGAFMFSGRYK